MTRRHVILLMIAIGVAAIILLPLRLAIGIAGIADSGVVMRSASGRLWDGRVEDVRVGGAEFGNLDVGLRALPLLLARAEVEFARLPGSALGALDGRLVRSPWYRGVADLSGALAIRNAGPIPIEAIRFDGVSAGFSGTRCVAGSGRVQVTLGVRIAGLALRDGLSGILRCDGQNLVVPLAGASGMERLTLRIAVDGTYVARLVIRADDPVLGAALSIAGFRPTAQGFVRTERGRF